MTSKTHWGIPVVPSEVLRSARLPLPICLTLAAAPYTASAQCRHCSHCIRWLSTRSPAERQARRQPARQQAIAAWPPSQLQLVFLQALGDDGLVPGSMWEASQRIDAALVWGGVA
jgi:hypothetical protein